WTLPPQLQEHHAVAKDGTDNDLAIERPLPLAVLPQLGVGFGIKGGETVLTRYEQVGLAVMLHQQRGRMGRPDGPFRFPPDLAGALVQANQEARPRVMIPGE